FTGLAAVAAVRMAIEVGRRRRHPSMITVHENGLHLKRISGEEVIPWDRITSIRYEQRKRVTQTRGIQLPGVAYASVTTQTYWVAIACEGSQPLFDAGTYDDDDALVDAMTRAIERREVPRTLEALNTGAPAPFGAITLLPTHVSLPQGTLAWEEVTGARF